VLLKWPENSSLAPQSLVREDWQNVMLKGRGTSCLAAWLVTDSFCCRPDDPLNEHTEKRWDRWGSRIKLALLSLEKIVVFFLLLCLSLQVCPQFETTKSVVLKACQKQHCSPHKPQNQDANHSLLRAGGACRRAIACKFPPLTFETPEGYAVHPSDHPYRSRKNTQHARSQPKKGTAAKATIQGNSLENCRETPFCAAQPAEAAVFSLPDVETPQAPSVGNWRVSGRAWQPAEELAFGIDPGGRGEPAAVLVTDTPEHDYGVKVTWRRRPRLMRYLRESGKLSAADVLVKTALPGRGADA